MYYCGQVVYHHPSKSPVKLPNDGTQFVWDGGDINLCDTTHFIEPNPKYQVYTTPPFGAVITLNNDIYCRKDYFHEQQYSCALPASVEEAQRLLDSGLIVPAPRSK